MNSKLTKFLILIISLVISVYILTQLTTVDWISVCTGSFLATVICIIYDKE